MRWFVVVLTCVQELIQFSAGDWSLNLLHVNDIHVRMEQTNKYSARCRSRDQEIDECYGGLARLYTAVHDLKRAENNTIWLNAGDFYQGTFWYSHFKWKVVSHFNKLMAFDAMCLGNHEFDDGVEGLEPFLRNASCPVLAANIDISREPTLSGLISPSLIMEVDHRRIGIVGYTTPETTEVSNPGRVTFNEEVGAVRAEVEELKSQGIDIIIGLGHSGYDRDIEIAENVADIDIIIGGHTHSFLYDDKEENPSVEDISGPYPTLVKNRTLVLQAYAYTKYLGHMNIKFSDDGKLLEWTGEPILLDHKIKEDENILKELAPWKKILNEIGKTMVGKSGCNLLRDRQAESTIGNLVTDVMVWAHRDKKLDLAIVNSGGIRASFSEGNITMEDLLNSFPFRNTFDVVVLTGETLRKVLEHSVNQMKRDGENDSGRFLQVSGFKLIYNISKPVGERIQQCLIRCSQCKVKYQPLKDSGEYSVVLTNYVAGGGDGYSMIPQEAIKYLQGPLDTDILQEYIKIYSPLKVNLEGRISFTGVQGQAEELTGSGDQQGRPGDQQGRPGDQHGRPGDQHGRPDDVETTSSADQHIHNKTSEFLKSLLTLFLTLLVIM